MITWYLKTQELEATHYNCLNPTYAAGGATSTFVRKGRNFILRGWGWQRGASPPGENFFSKKLLFSEFEVKKQHFLIVEGMALCSIIYQIFIITMACSCVPSPRSFSAQHLRNMKSFWFLLFSLWYFMNTLFNFYIVEILYTHRSRPWLTHIFSRLDRA